MFGIGETELVIIVVFAFLLFGPDKLPGMGRTLGRVLRQFREASDGFTEVVQTNIMDPASEELEKSPKQRKREEEAAAEASSDSSAKTDAQDAAPHRETFAERKARLKAEREAAAAAQESATEAVPEQANEPGAGREPDAPARTSAADLYAISSTRRSSRSRATEEAATDDASDEQDLGEEDGSAKA